MDGRELIIVAPIKVDGELESNPVIQKINIIIEFINKNRYRLPAEKDSEYKQENPKADMRNDIELREKLARDLAQEGNVLGIIQQVHDALIQKYQNVSERQSRLAKFNRVLDGFLRHIQFVHLTAVELAIVGMMVDTLIILLYQAKNELRDDAAHISALNKQNELLRIRANIAACMAYHQVVFNENDIIKDKKEFYYSDIVINFFDAIENGTDIHLAEERKNLWPDMSYLQVLPEIPFYKLDELKTVARYFKEFGESLPPGAEDVSKLQDDIRDELSLLSEEEEVVSRPPPAQEEQVQSSYLCFWPSWSRSQPASPREPRTQMVELLDDWQELDSEENTAPSKETPKLALDDIILLMSSFNAKAQEKLNKMEFEQGLRSQIIALQSELQSEIIALQKPSCFACFSFFWTGTLHKKLVKEAALRYVLSASTVQELGQRANEKLNGDDKEVVCAGWHSRTEALLTRIAEAVEVDCEDVSQAELMFL